MRRAHKKQAALVAELVAAWDQTSSRDRGEIMRRWPDLAGPTAWLAAHAYVRRNPLSRPAGGESDG